MNEAEHLLVCLNEECLEIAKDADKALRFGMADRNVLKPDGPTNQEKIIMELNDLMGVIGMLIERGMLPVYWKSEIAQAAKKERVEKFMRYAVKAGTMTRMP